jgi:hypothetical protein
MISRLLDPDTLSRTYPIVRSRLTYANVMSTIGVFLALGGGAVAAGGGGGNGGGDKGSHHQGDGSGSNGGGDNGGNGGNGGNGHKGDKGDNGDNGGDNGGNNGGGNDSTGADSNASGPLNVTTREGDPVKTDQKTSQAVATASCEDNETLVGGGVKTESEKDKVRGQPVEGNPVVQSSGPDGNGWSATVLNDGSLGGVKVTAYAICAASSSSSSSK